MGNWDLLRFAAYVKRFVKNQESPHFPPHRRRRNRPETLRHMNGAPL
jgi:hypothetical protein